MAFFKRYFKFIGFFLSALFLYLTFRNANLALILKNLRFLNPLLICAAFCLYFLFYVVRALYQRNNLAAIKPGIGFGNSLASIALSLFFNVIFPARLGEVVRTFYLYKRENLSKASVLSYILIEKLIDFLFMVFLLLVLLVAGFSKTESGVELRKIAFIASAAGLAILSLAFIYVKFNRVVFSILMAVTPKKTHSSLARMNESALEGIRFYRSAGQVARGAALMILSWVIVMGVFSLVVRSYVTILNLPVYSGLFFMVFSSLSLAIPSAPAGIGVVHYGLYLAVRLLSDASPSYDMNLVGAFTIVVQFLTGILMDLVIGGGISLYFRARFGRVLFVKTLSETKSAAAEYDEITRLYLKKE